MNVNERLCRITVIPNVAVPDFFIPTPSLYVFQFTLGMSHFVITGGTGGTTAGAAAPNRLEINTLIQNQEQFSLYIQALS